MATITNTRFVIGPDRLHNRASIMVTCDVDFTDVEVNAMNVLGLCYELRCRVVDRNVVDEPVAEFSPITLPRRAGGAMPLDHVRFSTEQPTSVLHGQRLFGKDQLMAYVTLINTESGTSDFLRSAVTSVDLT